MRWMIYRPCTRSYLLSPNSAAPQVDDYFPSRLVCLVHGCVVCKFCSVTICSLCILGMKLNQWVSHSLSLNLDMIVYTLIGQSCAVLCFLNAVIRRDIPLVSSLPPNQTSLWEYYFSMPTWKYNSFTGYVNNTRVRFLLFRPWGLMQSLLSHDWIKATHALLPVVLPLFTYLSWVSGWSRQGWCLNHEKLSHSSCPTTLQA